MNTLKPWQALLLATRPKTLTIAFIPIVVGTLLAHRAGYPINWKIAFFTLLVALCIQIGTNFINDALDFKKGADTKDRIGPFRASQSGIVPVDQVYFCGLASFALAIIFAIPLISVGGWPIVVLLVLSIASGYLYTGGPWPLAYCGVSELFVIAFFGIGATGAAYYLQTGTFDARPVLAGLQIGSLATVVLAINNLRDHLQDVKVGKRTLAVRFGERFAKFEISALAILPFSLTAFWLYYPYFFTALLPWLSIGLLVELVVGVWKHEPGPVYNTFLAKSALLHLVFGILMSIGLCLA